MKLTLDECLTIRYALRELSSRRREQAIDRKDRSVLIEAEQIDQLADRIVATEDSATDVSKLLSKYGMHTEDCFAPKYACTCGLTELLGKE